MEIGPETQVLANLKAPVAMAFALWALLTSLALCALELRFAASYLTVKLSAWILGVPVVTGYALWLGLRGARVLSNLLRGNRGALFLKSGNLIFLDPSILTVPMSEVRDVELRMSGGLANRSYAILSLAGPREKYVPLYLLNLTVPELRARLSELTRIAATE